MPSISIHLAIAKRYADSHPGDIKDLAQFARGTIEPDFKDDLSEIRTRAEKMETHFYDAIDSDSVDFRQFFDKVSMDTEDDYWKGYFLHLIADHLFYTDDFRAEYVEACKSGIYLYNDYSILTPDIFQKYKVTSSYDFFTDKVRECLEARIGKLKYLSLDKVFAFIEKIATPSIAEDIERFKR